MILKILCVVVIAAIAAWILIPEFKDAVIYWLFEHDFTGRSANSILSNISDLFSFSFFADTFAYYMHLQ